MLSHKKELSLYSNVSEGHWFFCQDFNNSSQNIEQQGVQSGCTCMYTVSFVNVSTSACSPRFHPLEADEQFRVRMKS